MVYRLNLWNCYLTDGELNYLDKLSKRMDRFLPDFVGDEVLLDLYLDFHDTKGYFIGSLFLHFPKQTLAARFKSASLIRGLKIGFRKLKRVLREYKGQHFIGGSQLSKSDSTLMEEA